MSRPIKIPLFLLLISLFISNSTSVSADESCSYDILKLNLGMTETEVRDIMLEQGFREQEMRHGMQFTNAELWPPEGVELSRQQIRIALQLQDPRRKEMYKKKAETDPVFKELLAGIPSMPARKDSIIVTVSTARRPTDTSSIFNISARYLFPSDRNDSKREYSPAHKLLMRSRWQTYCADIEVSSLANHWYTEKVDSQFRSCKDSPTALSIPFQILIHPQSNKDKQGCRYNFSSGLQEASENLK